MEILILRKYVSYLKFFKLINLGKNVVWMGDVII